MPKIFVTNPEKYESVTRPMAMGMVKQIMKNTGLDERMNIMYLGDATQQLQPGTAIDGTSKDISFPHTNKVTVSVQEDHLEDRMSSQVLHRPENAFIFLDKKLETYIKPVYSTTKTSVTFHYRAADRNSAIRWRDDFQVRLLEGRDVQLFEGVYHYPLPLELHVILEEIHTLREKQGGYGDTLDQWFANHVDPRFRVITDQGGKNPLLVIAETQGEIEGVWDFGVIPRHMDKEGDAENWAVEVNFTYNYEQPVGCDMSYPLVIHNQMIKYRPTRDDRPDKLIKRKKVMTSSGEYLAMFQAGREVPKSLQYQGILVPWYDEFIANQVTPSTMRVADVLVNITTENKRSLMNLRDLLPAGYEIKPCMQRLFESEAPYIHLPFRSIFNISLYRSTQMQSYEKVRMDADLNIYATEDLDIREYYHIRIAVMYDLNCLKKPDRDRLKLHGCAFADIMKELLPYRRDVKIIGDCYVPGTEITDAGDDIDKSIRGSNDMGWQFNTVETLFVEVMRKEDLHASA